MTSLRDWLYRRLLKPLTADSAELIRVVEDDVVDTSLMDRRYQVFVSSTYTDLIDERRELIQALLEMECLPAGMELFPAANESQWELIKQAIDDSDYYVVVVGGRYGSMGPEGVSYTEQEYDYAVSTGMPVLGFVHQDPDSLPRSKSEVDPDGYARLAAFREKVKSRPVRFYTTAEDLGGKVSRSLTIARTKDPREGWIRGRYAMTPEQQTEMAELRASVSELTRQLENLRGADERIPEHLASGEDEYEIVAELDFYAAKDLETERGQRNYYRTQIGFDVTWNEIIYELGARLLNEASEADIWEAFQTLCYRHHTRGAPKDYGETKDLRPETDCLSDIIVQLFALNLITHGVKKRSTTDRNKYWALTPLGQDTLMKLRAIPKERAEDDVHQ
jgi:DNA-binding PadR family transcriptional regulator